MFEESISCSPGKERKHSRSRRFHKKATRRSQRLSGPPIPKANVSEEVSFMDALYEDSTHPEGSTTVDHYNDFNPFENARIIAAADKAKVSTYKSKLQLLSQGFVKLVELPLKETDFFAEPLPSISNPKPTTVTGPETQFGITESEFVRFCDDAEFDIESPSAKETKTPKPGQSIVDEILNDFCGSPYSESPPKLLTDDSTPVFRFKSKSLRTYSRLRKQKSRRNIVSELANANLPDDDSNTSDSSGLSIQEDLSPYIVPQLNTVDLNNSIKVCENLLNLSLHFSQLSSHVKSSPETDEKFPMVTPTIQDEIMQMRRKHFTIVCSKSPDEFYGFSDVDDEEDTLKELLKDEEDDVLQEINCDSLCYEKVVQTTSVTRKMEADQGELDMEMEDFGCNGGICDNNKDNLRGASHNSLQEEEQLFDDIDIWSDAECLLNYKTQNPHSNIVSPIRKQNRVTEYNDVRKMSTEAAEIKQRERDFLDQPSTSRKYSMLHGTFKEPALSSFLGYSTASKKSIEISVEAQRKANAIIAEFEQAELEQTIKDDLEVRSISFPTVSKKSRNAEYIFKEKKEENYMPGVSPSTTTFVGYSTSSSKPILTSVDPKRKANQLLENFEQETKEMKETEENTPETSGFFTASQKPISISAGAKRKAVEIIEKFEKEERGICMSKGEVVNIPNADKLVQEKRTLPFVGFKTASKKPIAISNEAKRRASAILEKLEIEERDKIAGDATNDVTPSAFLFSGFSTQSNKPFAISDESQRKANAILENFEIADRDKIAEDMENDVTPFDPTTDIPKRKANAILGNIEIAENTKNNATPSVSSLVGSKKLISIPPAAQRKAYAILDEWDQPEQVNKDVTPTISSFVGFSTASKKPIAISDQAKRKARAILEKFENDERSQIPEEVKNDVSLSASTFVGFSTATKKPIAISDQAKRKASAVLEKFEKDERDQIPEEVINDASLYASTFVGFSTASKKPIAISDEAKCKAEVLLRKFEQDEVVNDEVAVKIRLPDQMSDEAKKKAEELLMDIEFFTEAFEEELSTIDQQTERHEPDPLKTPPKTSTNNPPFEAFKTASNKRIQVSDAAKQHANQLLSQVEKEGLSQDFLKCIDADLQVFSSRSIVEQADEGRTNLAKNQHSSLGKQQTHVHAPATPSSYTNPMNDLPIQVAVPASKRLPRDIESVSSPQEYDITDENSSKRKRTQFYTEDLHKSPIERSPLRLSCSEQTPIHHKDDAVLQKTSSMPHIKPTPKSAFISRKNLLSLSKRRKFNSPRTIGEVSNGPKTPEKMSSQGNANATPNLKEFFNSVSTSTPRLIRNIVLHDMQVTKKDTSIDSDFRQINWDDGNSSVRVSQTSSIANANVSHPEVSPSPKQRIERLKMYGEPPPISPILMVNTCRPSGLRRGRSRMKP